ncbi:damage-control phosphatase At2g17340-like isoform X2 [Malus domestica]|uniref:damage-control phosphatase At2g17340-like isoform X2 n=1 Tax=Malus domestica TaxID=3750 RepID=UPI00397583EA
MKAQWQQLQRFNYRACTIPYRFPSDNPRKPTPTELSWIDLLYNSTPSFKKRAEFDASVPDAPTRAKKFAQGLECRHFPKPSVLKVRNLNFWWIWSFD